MFIYTSLFRDGQLPTRRTTDFFSLCFLDTIQPAVWSINDNSPQSNWPTPQSNGTHIWVTTSQWQSHTFEAEPVSSRVTRVTILKPSSQQVLLPQNILSSLMSTSYNLCHQHKPRIIPDLKLHEDQQATLFREIVANQYALSYLSNEFGFFVSVIECWCLPSTINGNTF